MLLNWFILAVILLELEAVAGNYVCPRGVPKDGYSKVYGKTCYRFVLVNRRYFWDANDYCSRHSGGTLAMIKDEDTKTFLANQIKDNFEKIQYWVGMYRKITSGFVGFVHIDGSIVNGEPRPHSPHLADEDCVTLSESGYMGFNFCRQVVYFRSSKLPYICQYPAWDDPSITTREPTTRERTTREPTTTTVNSTAAPTTSSEAPTPKSKAKMCAQCGSETDSTPCSTMDMMLPTVSECPVGKDYCMNTVATRQPLVVYKKCADYNTCEKMWLFGTSDREECTKDYPSGNGCHYCCGLDGCNANRGPEPNRTSLIEKQ